MPEPSLLDVECLEKVLAIHRLDAEYSHMLQRLVHQPRVFKKQMKKIEQLLPQTKLNNPKPQSETGLTAKYYQLYQTAVGSARLHRLLPADPLLSAKDPDQLQIVLNFADVTPTHEPAMFVSQDPVFMRVLPSYHAKTSLSVPRILVVPSPTSRLP